LSCARFGHRAFLLAPQGEGVWRSALLVTEAQAVEAMIRPCCFAAQGEARGGAGLPVILEGGISMRKKICRVLVPALVLAVAIPVMAQEKEKRGARKKPGTRGRQAQVLPKQLLEGLELTAEQKAKLEAIVAEMKEAVSETRKTMDDLLTEDQKAARREAMKAAREAGKKPQEAQKAVAEALQLTEDQQEKMAKVKEKMTELQKKIRDRVMEVLTPEQRKTVEEKMKARRGPGKKAGEKRAGAGRGKGKKQGGEE